MSQAYPLNVLLELREAQKTDAQASYAVAIAALERCRRDAELRREALARAISHRLERCEQHAQSLGNASFDLGEVHRFQSYLQGLQAHEAELNAQLDQALALEASRQQAATKARQALLDANVALKAAQEHHHQWKREQELHTRRKQSDELDDVAARIWAVRHT